MSKMMPDLTKEILIFDGAMGTMIQRSKLLKPGDSPEMLNISHPDLIQSIHKSYIAAGSKCIETNTFGGNSLKLEAHGLGNEKVRELNTAAVKNAKEAAKSGTGILVAGSMGPTGKLLEPLGDLTFKAAFNSFKEQATVLAGAGVDLLIIETMSDILETKAAILAAIDLDLPVIATVSFMENGRLLTGQTPEMVASVLSGFPLLALGANCGLSAAGLIPIVAKLLTYSKLPVIAQPNAGKPSLSGDETVYLESPREYADSCLELLKSGVRIIGGCCGTTPEHIKLLTSGLTNIRSGGHRPLASDYLVGKGSLIPVAEISETEVYRFRPEPQNQLWAALCQGNSDPLIDFLLALDPNQIKVFQIEGPFLTDSDAANFQELLNLLVTYWPNPISAGLNAGLLIEILLTQTPGRTLVMTDSNKPELNRMISRFGGVFSAGE
ncbi:MAG: homocysteine S-methyltransferase family protein [Bacillota bacterium]